jgi:circadian clock protein KaiC
MQKNPTERTSIGLPNLDKLLEGGLPKGTINLVSGACGTGKTIMALHFIYYGAKYLNEPGVYITLEEDPEELINNMRLFGWDIDELITKKKIAIIRPVIYKFDSLKQIISDAIGRVAAKRIVVDSYSVLLGYFSDLYKLRNGLVHLDQEIKKMGCTALIISDINDGSDILSASGLEEYIVDGVVVLYLMKKPIYPYEAFRALSIRKMRSTHHPLDLYPFEITDQGIRFDGKSLEDMQNPGRNVRRKAERGKCLGGLQNPGRNVRQRAEKGG